MRKRDRSTPSLTPEESETFQNAMRGVKKMQQDKVPLPTSEKPLPKRRQKAAQSEEDFRDNLPYLGEISEDFEVQADETVSYCDPSVRRLDFRKLKQGKQPIEAELDLHGYTRPQAERAFLEFIRAASMAELRVVRIIHGKGQRQSEKAVLKTAVIGWLQKIPETLAYCTAQPKDGGLGAVYVMLRRAR